MLILKTKGNILPNLSKRATVYFDPAIHRVLKVKAAETSTSISNIIDKAIRRELREDEEALRAFNERVSEPTITYDKLVADLKKNGKI
jgi:hypothetical protein